MKRDASLQQVLENPDDDQLRLVYADALSERGDARGELIAVQCALAARPDDEGLRAREAELLQKHRGEWFGPLEAYLRERNPEEAVGYVVRRGFVEHVRVRLSGQRGEVDELFKLVPSLRSLEVNGEGLTASKALRKLERLTVTGIIGEVSDLLIEGYFDELRALDLQVIDGEPGPGLSRLTELTEFRSTWAVRGLWPLPRRLKVLDGYGEDVIRTQLTTPRKALRELGLRSATLDAETIDGLAMQAPYLERLMLKMSRVSAPMFERLFRVEWPSLQRLELQGVSLSAEGTAALGNLWAPQLSQVDLDIAQLRDEGARQVLKLPWLKQLTRLSLVANRLTDDGLVGLVKAKHQLEELVLQKNQISAAFVAKLKRLDSFRDTLILR